ncbi:MAG: hypothetical protein IKE24_12895 [Clostridia bacterium]|nr:hypothetical protein [Clostridia bacterium]
MSRLDPTVKKETAYAALWVTALSLIMEAVFLIGDWWTPAVLLGNMAGAVTAVLNYLLLGITVAKAVSGPAEKAPLKVRSSMTARLLGQAAVVAVAIGVFHTNVYATLLPLLFPRIGIAFRPMIDRKRGKTAVEPEGSDLLD